MNLSGSGIKLRHLQVLREVMRAGSERVASHALGITQPAVSQNLKQLEETIGFSLFARENNRLLPNNQAWELLRSIDSAFAGLDRLGKVIDGIRTDETRTVCIAVPAVFCLRSIPQAVKAIRNDNPSLTVQVRTGSYKDVTDYVLQGKADIAVSRLPLDDRVLNWRPVGSAVNVCVFPEGHRFSELDVVKAEDLIDEPLIDIDPQYSSHQMNVNALRFMGAEPNLAVEYDLNAHDVGFVAAGIGVSVINEIAAREYRQFGLLYRPFEPGAVYHYVAAWQKDRQLSHSLSMALEKILAAFATD